MGLTKYRRKQNVDVLFPSSLMIEDDIIFSFKRVNFGYENLRLKIIYTKEFRF